MLSSKSSSQFSVWAMEYFGSVEGLVSAHSLSRVIGDADDGMTMCLSWRHDDTLTCNLFLQGLVADCRFERGKTRKGACEG